MTYHNSHPRPAPPSAALSNPAYVSITLRLADPGDDLLVRHVRLLRDCVALAQQRWGFVVDAAVVLPSEIQLLCGFDDADFAAGQAIRLICASFNRHVPGFDAGATVNVWADQTEVVEITPAVLALRRQFIEAAPVRAGLVKIAADWPYSSVQTSIGQGQARGTGLGVAVA